MDVGQLWNVIAEGGNNNNKLYFSHSLGMIIVAKEVNDVVGKRAFMAYMWVYVGTVASKDN